MGQDSLNHPPSFLFRLQEVLFIYPSHDTTGKRRVKADELRSKLEELESAYDEVTRTAQVEILQAKDNLKKAEMETLQVCQTSA